MTPVEQLKDKVNQAEDLARKIWLAGLGAYGKGVDEAQGQYEKLNSEATKLFDELVAKGEKLEEDAKNKLTEETVKVKDSVESRVAEVREKLGFNEESADDKIDQLAAKIDALTEAVAKLAKS